MQANMKPFIKDFDKLIKKEKYAILAGVKIDVSSIPSRVVIQLSSFQSRMASDEISADDSLTEIVALAARVCAVRNPEITVDWILDNTDMETLTEFVKFVLAIVENTIDPEKKTEE